jgi:hypothetical protein
MLMECCLRVSASVSSWLPWLKDFLPSLVLLEEKASELYHLSLLEKPFSFSWAQETFFGVNNSGKKLYSLHDHLLKQGFRKEKRKVPFCDFSQPVYFREDMGALHFISPQTRPYQKPSSRGLSALPDKRVSLLLENPNSVEVKYLNQCYEVKIPQVGRFILEKGLQLKIGRFLDKNRIYSAAIDLMLILDLMVSNEELQEEAALDLLEVRPPSLIREFLDNLKMNGPGSVIWDSAQKLFLEIHPESKIVSLTSWYWKFLSRIARLLVEQRESV